MKSFRDVEATRREYHQDAALNSVHRSSLSVPEMPGAIAEISFVNHFLLKRGYTNIACRVTALDPEGLRIESRLHPVTEAKVYTLPLTGMVEHEVSNYLIEFFSAENLFIPFPAVMVNHRGPGFLNTVHAYNRVLNDVFEDDTINAKPVAEASIDVQLDEETDTFLTFSAGPQRCQGELEIELVDKSARYTASVALDQPRLTNQHISLAELFADAPANTRGNLRIWQPPQFLFYGRMLAGMRKADGAFSANHSYYDSSSVAEYWDDARSSWRTYPYFQGLENRVRMYPIMSEGRLRLSIEPFAADGSSLGSYESGEIKSPGPFSLDISVDALLADAGVDITDIASFAVVATPIDGNTPTRVNHQLVHHTGALASSVNMSLNNPNIFVPDGKAGFAWGQVPLGRDLDSWLGFAADRKGGNDCDVEVVFYDHRGEIARRNWALPANGAISCIAGDELAREHDMGADEAPNYLWYVARAARPDLSAYTVTRHRHSEHCTGEHNF